MRTFTRRILISIISVVPFAAFATGTGTLSTEDTLKQLILIVSQYDARIKALEAENGILKTQVMKAGIKIPMTDFTGAIVVSQTGVTIPSTYLTGILTPVQSTATGLTLTSNSGAMKAALQAQYGVDVGGFIARIQTEWKDVRNAYKLPENAAIGGYEFVQKDANDHVFVDIIFGTGVTGIYDAKILYQYDKSTFKRKLIGFFEYNATTGKYTTKSGTNPFAGVTRTFVRDPYFAGATSVPSTATTSPTTTGNTQTVTNTPTVTPPTGTSTVTLSEVEKAYSEKRYLSVISLSNSYLTANVATYDLLRIRYRTYFIIGKYSESLAEIAKIEALGKLDKQTACDGQVIATYSKDTSLVSKYAAVCK